MFRDRLSFLLGEAKPGLSLLPVLQLHCVSGALAGLVPTSSCLSGSAQSTERGLHLSEAWGPFPIDELRRRNSGKEPQFGFQAVNCTPLGGTVASAYNDHHP